MKHIIDRVLVRTKKQPELIELGIKVHEDLIEKYCCNKPTIRDLEELFRDLGYDVDKNMETHLKIQTTFKLLNKLR